MSISGCQSHRRILSTVARLASSEAKVRPSSTREGLHRDLPQVVGLPRQRDVALDIGRLELQLARLHIEAVEQRGKDHGDQERAAEQQRHRRRGDPPAPPPHIEPRGEGAGGGQADEEPQHRQPDMEVGVAGADHDAVVAVEQQEAIESVGPGLDREVEAEQHRPMDDGGGRDAPGRRVELDVAVRPIDDAPARAALRSTSSISQFLSAR